MGIVGRIDEGPHATWYVLDDGRQVTVHVAYLDGHPKLNPSSKTATFFSDINHFGSVTAQRLGLNAFFIRPATTLEAEAFWQGRNETVKEIIYV